MDLVSSPRFAAVTDGERLALETEERAWLLEGRVYVDIARGLAQGITAEALQAALEPLHGVADLARAVLELSHIGFLRSRPEAGVPLPEIGWWESAGGDPGGCVAIETWDRAATDAVLRALGDSGIRVSEHAPLGVALLDDYRRADVDCRERPLLLAHLTGPVVSIGPLLRPGGSPCASCMRWWLSLHSWEQRAVSTEFSAPPPAFTGASLSLAAGALVSAIVRVLLGRGKDRALEKSRLLLDTRTLRRRTEAFGAAPGCPACGGSALPVEPPRDLVRFVSRIGGMVRRLEVSHRTYAGIHHARAEFVYPGNGGNSALRSCFSSGGAATRRRAATACVAEAVERYSLAWTGQPTELATADPRDILLHSAAQYARRSPLDPAIFAVPELPGSRPIHCVRAREGLLVPAGVAFFAWPFPGEPTYAHPDSNGCAAGCTVEDALCSAFHELVERDSLSIWWDNRCLRPAVHIDDARVCRILAALHEEGRTPWLLDITTDLGIAACVAVAPRTDGSSPVFASAAHTRPQDAAYGALRELSGIAFGLEQAPAEPLMAAWLRDVNVFADGMEWLRPAGEVEWRRSMEPPASVEIRGRIGAAGIATDWIDLTRVETGVPVVRAIAPGLRHPWRRYAPGRLFDVPARLGWRSRALAEDELNPAGCFL